MRILLTGGSGDLGQVVSKALDLRGDIPVCLDVRAPMNHRGKYIEGSILDRPLLKHRLAGIDCIVHIAAWHGIHEVTNAKNPYEFWDLNVTGTFNMFEAASEAGIGYFVYLSSTSIRDELSVYGHSKVMGEEIAHTYAQRHGMRVIILRPRAFIPYWNKSVYSSFVEWAKWFWPGAVHINDVSQAVMQAVDLLASRSNLPLLTLDVDGAYEYTDEDLDTWDGDGPGTTFNKYYPEYYDLALHYGLEPVQKPKKLDIGETRLWLGYEPQYSLRNLLMELDQFGEMGPPPPTF